MNYVNYNIVNNKKIRRYKKMNENTSLVYFGYEDELDYDYAPDYEVE